MLDRTYVEVCGKLSRDVEVKLNIRGKPYGILSIEVNSLIGYSSSDAQQATFETKWFRVTILNEELINRLSSALLKGTKVLVIGELDIIQADESDPLAQIIIKVTSSTGIIVISKPNQIRGFEDEIFYE
jgi:single-stranded DNA-binding protein